MNPDKRKIGCIVPRCMHEWCDYSKKSFCALRKHYLREQAELRRIKFSSFDSEVIEIIENKIKRLKNDQKTA